MSAIKVHGETYENVASLNETIDELTAQYEDMPDGAGRMKLAAHVATLRAAAEGSGSDDGAASPADAPEDEPEPMPQEEEEEGETEPTHSLIEAADYGKPLACPLCGNEVPFPESPPLDKFATRCGDCDGWGKVLTGSRVDGNVWRDCKGCNGSGFREDSTASAPTPLRKAADAPEAPGAIWNADNESWNPPPGVQPPWAGATWDSFYGKWS